MGKSTSESSLVFSGLSLYGIDLSDGGEDTASASGVLDHSGGTASDEGYKRIDERLAVSAFCSIKIPLRIYDSKGDFFILL